jgi:hypothetical protein
MTMRRGHHTSSVLKAMDAGNAPDAVHVETLDDHAAVEPD